VNGASGNTRLRRRFGRRVALILALCVGLAVALVWLGAALRQWSSWRAAFPQTAGSLRFVGLDAPVVVHRDTRGVPHVRAENERDGFFALGFVHAQDRLAQMLWLDRLARGRTAEVTDWTCKQDTINARNMDEALKQLRQTDIRVRALKLLNDIRYSQQGQLHCYHSSPELFALFRQ